MNKSKSVSVSLVFFLVCYFLSAFLKISAAAVLPLFQSRMNLSSSAVGLISSMFFISYALAQMFSGLLCNMFGSHAVMGAGLVISSVGTLCFSLANSPAILACGRFLMGMGIGPAFVCTFSFLQENYEGKSYSSIAGFSIMICNLGAACSSAPLKMMLRNFDLPSIFMFFTVLQLSIAVLFFLEKRHYSNHRNIRDTSLFVQLKSSFQVITGNKTVTGLIYIWVLYNSFLVVYQGLWITQWTSYAFPSLAEKTAISGTIISIGLMIGSCFSDKLRIRRPYRTDSVIAGERIDVVLMVMVVAVRIISHSPFMFILSVVIDFLYGIAVGVLCVQVTSCVRENTDVSHNAVILGIFNFAANVSVQILQWITGVLIDAFSGHGSSLLPYSVCFSIFAVMYVVCSFMAVRVLKNRE